MVEHLPKQDQPKQEQRSSKLPPAVSPGAQEQEPVNNLEVYKKMGKQVGSPERETDIDTNDKYQIKE